MNASVPLQISTSVQDGIVAFYATFTGISFLENVILIVMAVCEPRRRNSNNNTTQFSFTTVLNPLNATLFGTITSLAGVYIARAINSSISLDIPYGALFTVEQFFIACFQTLGVLYSFLRSRQVLKAVYGEQVRKWILFATKWSPFVFFSPLASTVWREQLQSSPSSSSQQEAVGWLDFVLQVATGIYALIMDTVFVSGYMKYLLRTRLEGESVNRSLGIIAAAGTVTCVGNYASVFMFVVSVIFKKVETRAIMVSCAHAFVNGSCVAQLVMKFMLTRIKMNEIKGISTTRNSSRRKESYLKQVSESAQKYTAVKDEKRTDPVSDNVGARNNMPLY